MTEERLPLDPAPAALRPADYFRLAQAPATRRAYQADWSRFGEWCRRNHRQMLPAAAETLIEYLTEAAGTVRAVTLSRRLAAISQAHRLAGHDSPTAHIAVGKLMSGIRRGQGTAARAKRPVLVEDLRRMLAGLESSRAIDVRDRALVLIGFAAALRRSELVALDVADVEAHPDGLVLTLRRSKTDQQAQGRRIGIPRGASAGTCPVRALADWMELLGAGASGALFRRITRHQAIGARLTAQSVALIVKRLAGKASLDAGEFSGHSLRAGLATTAAAAGVSERAIMRQTGHRSVATLRKYIREGSLFLENAAGRVGL